MGRPPKSTLVQTLHSPMEELGLREAQKLDVPGYGFRWVNVEHRYKHGWEIWRPVLRSSDLGAKIVEQLGPGNDRYNGKDQDSDMIYQGSDSVLAYAPAEHIEALTQHKRDLAAERINQIDGDLQRRNVVVPGSGGFMKQVGGN